MNTTIIVGRRIRKFLKKPFPKRLCMLLLILCFSSLSIIVHAQSELIGKNIIIPPLNNYYQYSFDSFYHGTDFHKEKLEKKYHYKANAEGFTPPEAILGHEFEIIDVFNIDSRKPEKKSINIVMVEKDFKDTILFRIPLAIITVPYSSEYLTIKSFSSLYCTYSKAGPFRRSELVFDFVPRFNFTHYYDTDYIEQIEDTFMGKEVFVNRKAEKPQFYKFVKFTFKKTNNYFRYLNAVLQNDSIEDLNIEIIDPSLKEFSTIVQTKEDFYKEINLRYDESFISELKDKYVGKEVWMVVTLGGLNERNAFDGNYARWRGSNTFTSSFRGWLQHDYGNGKKCICKSIELFLNTDKNNPSYCYYAVIVSPNEESGDSECLVPVTEKFSSWFLLSDEFEQYEKQRLTEHQAAEKELNDVEMAFYDAFIKNYGETNGNKIFQGLVDFGFTQEMCKLSRRYDPYRIDKVSTHLGLATRYHFFTENLYLYFVEDRLVGILEYGKKIRWK